MNKVIILGGSFDPIHNAHIEIAKIASKTLQIKEVWFLLANNPRWKENVTLFEHRHAMLKLALKNYPQFKISLEEKDIEATNYTIDTILKIIEKNPTTQFYYLIGSDQLEQLHLWKEIELLAKLVQFVHVKRKSDIKNFENIDLFNVINLDNELIPAASTDVRVGDFSIVSNEIKDYILGNYLYLNDRIKNDLSISRYEHSKSVANLAKEIAIANRYDGNIAFAAGLLHDCAKELPDKDIEQYIQKYYPNQVNASSAVKHQYVGVEIAKQKYHISNPDILSAIEKHSTAAPKMTILDKIIYCADKLENKERSDSLDLIEKCKKGINGGFKEVLTKNIQHLQKMKYQIDDNTLACLNNIKANATNEQLKIIVKTLDSKKAEHIVVIDVSDINPLTNYYVICNSLSTRQSLALADNIEEALLQDGFKVNHIEGRRSQEWILVDAYEIVVHIFTQETREMYNLEKLLYKQKFIKLEEILKNE